MSEDTFDTLEYENVRESMESELANLTDTEVGAFAVDFSTISAVLAILYQSGLIGDSFLDNSGGLVVAPTLVENWHGADKRIEIRYFSSVLDKEVVFVPDFELYEDESIQTFVQRLIELDMEICSFEAGIESKND